MSIDPPSDPSQPVFDELDEDGLPDARLDPRVRAVLRAVHTDLPRRPDAGTVHRHLAEMRRIRRRMRRIRRVAQVGRYGAIATAMVLVLAVAGMLPTTVQRAVADAAQVVGITLPTPTDGVPASEDQPADGEDDEADDEAGTSAGTAAAGGEAALGNGRAGDPSGDAPGGGAADHGLLALPPLPDLPDGTARAAEGGQQAREPREVRQAQEASASEGARRSEAAPSTSANRQSAPSDDPAPASADDPGDPSGAPETSTAGTDDDSTAATPTTEPTGHEPLRSRTEPATVTATGSEPALLDHDIVREPPLVHDRAGR